MLSCRDYWPWTIPGYIAMTRRQSNKLWSGAIAVDPTPNNSEIKNSLEKFSPSFLWIMTASTTLIYLQKVLTINVGVLLISAGAIEGHLKVKRCRKFTKGVLYLHDNASSHRAFTTQKKLVYLCFQCLDHPPNSPDLASSDYHLFPGLKSIEISPYFLQRGSHFCSGHLVWRTKLGIF